MKILFYIGNLKKGGAERVVANLSNELSKNNEVIIITTTNDKIEYELNRNIKLYTLNNNNIKNVFKKNIKYLKNLINIINSEKVDIAIGFLPEPSYRLLMIKNRIKCPVIISVRNNPKEEYKNIINKVLMRILYKRASGFVFQTRDAQNYFNKSIKSKSTVIANPVDDKFYDVKYDGINSKEIVTVGRLTNQKNQILLIKAFEKILEKHKNYKLLIYGTGELKENLKSYIAEHNLSNNIILCGNTDNVENEIKNKRMFVLPSLYEGMPNALMEALTIGVPSISTDCPCGGPKELIKNNESGILVRVNSVEDMYHAIERLIQNDKECLKFSKNSVKMMKEYKKDVISKKWLNYIQGVCRNEKNY